MDLFPCEIVEIKVEVDIQKVVEISDESESHESYTRQDSEKNMPCIDETVNIDLLKSKALLENVLSSKDELPDHGHICPHCGKIYKTAATLNIHCLLIHPSNEQTVQCIECCKTYPSAMSLQKHVHYKHKLKYRCYVCYKGYETPEALDAHKKACTKIETLCPKCWKTCSSQVSLRHHMAYKHPDNMENRCAACRKSFRSVRGLANHNATTHPAGATDCMFCYRSFNSNAALHSHLLHKHRTDGGGVQCNECRKVFSNQASLARHTLINHPFKDKLYVCGVCMASFDEATELQHHINNSHKDS